MEPAALAQLGAELAQLRRLLRRLDALAQHRRVQGVADLDQRAHDRGALGVAGQLRHEGAVDLHQVDREAAQVGERRVAGAEVVHRQPHPEPRERMHRLQRGVLILENRPLRYLDPHAAGLGAGGRDRRAHLVE
jgi:hypothetical protein